MKKQQPHSVKKNVLIHQQSAMVPTWVVGLVKLDKLAVACFQNGSSEESWLQRWTWTNLTNFIICEGSKECWKFRRSIQSSKEITLRNDSIYFVERTVFPPRSYERINPSSYLVRGFSIVDSTLALYFYSTLKCSEFFCE